MAHNTAAALGTQDNDYRELFYVPNGVYALSHSVGPMTRNAKQALHANYLESWQHDGSDAWGQWLGETHAFCKQIANVVRADTIDICPQTNLAQAFHSFLSAIAKLPKHKHQRVILMHEDAFASMGFVVNGLKQAYQLELVLVKGNPNDIEPWLQALEQHKVLACLFTHVHSNTSVVSNVTELCSLAKQFEAFSMVDVAQSIGIVDVKIGRAHV